MVKGLNVGKPISYPLPALFTNDWDSCGSRLFGLKFGDCIATGSENALHCTNIYSRDLARGLAKTSTCGGQLLDEQTESGVLISRNMIQCAQCSRPNLRNFLHVIIIIIIIIIVVVVHLNIAFHGRPTRRKRNTFGLDLKPRQTGAMQWKKEPTPSFLNTSFSSHRPLNSPCLCKYAISERISFRYASGC